MLLDEIKHATMELERLALMIEQLKQQERSSRSTKKCSDEIDMSQMVRVGKNLIHRDIYKKYGNPTVREIKTELQERHWSFEEDRDGNIYLIFRNDVYFTNQMTEDELQDLLLNIKISM